MAGRWTRQGRVLHLDGAPALYLEMERNPVTQNTALRPVEADAIADLLCTTLNGTNFEQLVKKWMKR